MKTAKIIAKIAVALAAIAGAVYVVATYGEQIVAWCKKVLASLPCPCKCSCDGECDCDCECEVVVEEAAEEAAPAEEATAEEAAEEAPAEEAPAVEEADFEN